MQIWPKHYRTAQVLYRAKILILLMPASPTLTLPHRKNCRASVSLSINLHRVRCAFGYTLAARRSGGSSWCRRLVFADLAMLEVHRRAITTHVNAHKCEFSIMKRLINFYHRQARCARCCNSSGSSLARRSRLYHWNLCSAPDIGNRRLAICVHI